MKLHETVREAYFMLHELVRRNEADGFTLHFCI
jgi:hypothetical protein